TLVQTIELDSLNPIADFDVISDQLINLEGTAVVCATFPNLSQNFANENDPNADTTFFWDFGYGLPWQISHDVNDVIDTCYYEEGVFDVCLVALNKNGCSDTLCKTLIIHDVPVLVAPNVFTPGDDDANDFFEFSSKAIAIEEFECVVVDRWGKEVFVFTSINDKWDGTNKNGKPCSDGVYFYSYRAVATNDTVFEGQGNVHLIRGN
ncbi:MAG: gliding motility-associated C-terminal domain-containing protein, partial [Crocinitomicaceae bacterium]|nr:gliding motility-associated C-terminal domain-containing protein [Crocinitomicaceae bacterium]